MESKTLRLIKAGGALITNKDRLDESPTLDVEALASILDYIRQCNGPVVLAHGNGSFGHPVAHRNMQRLGSRHWDAQAAEEIRAATRQLNDLVYDYLVREGLTVDRFFTEEFVRRGQDAVEFSGLLAKVLESIERGHLPLMYGALVDKPGGYDVLSTDELLAELGLRWSEQVKEVLLFSKEPGIKDKAGEIIPLIQRGELVSIQREVVSALPEDRVDVSGGMSKKVHEAGRLAEKEIPTYIGRPGPEPLQGTWIVAS